MTTVLDPPVRQPPVTADGGGGRTLAVDIVVPVHNEEADLGPSVRRLHSYLSTGFPFSWRITIADNASTDATPAVANQLSEQLPGVRVVRLDQKGRGRALKHTWLDTEAAVVAYLDVDLSTDLAALLPLVAPLLSGHSDVAIGSRLSHGARVIRGAKREVISRCYNLLLRTLLRARFTDAQCGFKAMRADRARLLLPHVRDTGWFWDTELLVLAERAGLRIHEVPVDWTDDADSRVDIVATALSDLRGIARLALTAGPADGELPAGVPAALLRRLGRFAVIGAIGTLAYIALFLLLRPSLGAQPANALAMLVTAIASTEGNRRFTFSRRGREGAVRNQFEGLVVFALGLAISSGALAAVHAADPDPATTVELAALVGANLLATVLRFVLLTSWVFHPNRRPVPVAQEPVKGQNR